MDETPVQLEEALENLPEEVEDFLYEGAYTAAVARASEALTLTEAQKKELDAVLLEVVVEIKPKDDLLALCDKWKFNEEQKKLFVARLEEYVFEPLLEMTNYVVIDDETLEGEAGNTEQKSSAAMISEQFQSPKPIAPVAREQQPEKQPETGIKKIDPYRELPE